ncbi:hypothetical protein J2S59_004003 [Nocardioides massiliensis]|uniref:Uncharacterized protein n=1 Tax=Nocardioides massiliensis TaxID=1325935 RepID=A0ABT9NUU4_9ACTN|nr:hypothetical protein [Nocardioides massiliensis]MDP9824194.1 hypothetical protein [Nocardioides massiliensis]
MLPERPCAFRTNTTSEGYRAPGCVNHGVRKPLTCTNGDEVSDLRSSGTSQVNGDRRPDLLAREKATGQLWLLPGTSSGFGAPQLFADGFDRFDLAG